MSAQVITGDCRQVLSTLEAGSFHACITSPPYWGLRDYGVGGQIGLEASVEEYVAELVGVFREVRRVLRPDGTVWLNLGDAYASSPTGSLGSRITIEGGQANQAAGLGRPDKIKSSGLKPKDLIGLPWRVAFALQADGWWLRSDIVWHKPNPMPESVRDRPTRAHEYVFLLSKSANYHFDADAVKEPSRGDAPGPRSRIISNGHSSPQLSGRGDFSTGNTRNVRSVWTIATQPFRGAHFATFPPKLVEPCVKAGCPEGGRCLDPFGGAGTVGLVCERLGRDATLIELNPDYVTLARARLAAEAMPLEMAA